MYAQTILFCTDLSEASEEARHHASRLASDLGAKLLILHVKEPLWSYGMIGGVYPMLPNDTEETQQLTHVLPDDPDVPFEHLFMVGDPADEILRIADEHEADMIVMGTHRRTGLKRLLSHGVAEEVVRKANCPVLTIRHHEGAYVENAAAVH